MTLLLLFIGHVLFNVALAVRALCWALEYI